MSTSAKPQKWQIFEVWGDTVDIRHLAVSIAIGVTLSVTVFLLANHWLSGHIGTVELARAYAMLVGLAGCISAGVICAILFPPKRDVVEGEAGNDFWHQEVLAKLAEQHGDLGSVEDLPPAVIKEMKELQIYDLFASYERAKALPENGSVQRAISTSSTRETLS